VTRFANDEPLPVIACTATAEEAERQVASIARLKANALVRREQWEGGLRLWFRSGPETERELRSFVEREQRCCAFFAFAIVPEGNSIRLDIGAPEEAGPFLEGLFC
jgi:hypothetical protein